MKKFFILFLILLYQISSSNHTTFHHWIEETNLYHVFVKQFAGNLQGLRQKLPHLQRLGIKTIWLMPIFESMSDHGYDTTDYYKIKSNLGTIEDLRQLVQDAKTRDIKIILDLVANHVGSQHKWFSSKDKNERKDHWFVWSPVDKKWGPPWPWREYSPTWRKDPYGYDRTGTGRLENYFYGAFDFTMPDFNYNDPVSRKELIEEFVNIMRFWIEKTGVSGFRCDAVRYMIETGPGEGQRDQPLTHELWKTFRKRLEEIDPSAILVAEAPTESYDKLVEYYGKGDEFHGAFHFRYPYLLISSARDERRHTHLLHDLHAVQNYLPSGTQDFVFLSNHDAFAGDRVATQLGNHLPKMKNVASLYLLLSGNPTIYYGEEIGMQGGGSDHALRQPFEWNVAEQQLKDPNSLLNHYTRLLKIRNHYDPLRGGKTVFVKTHSDGNWDDYYSHSKTLSIIRVHSNGEKVLIVHNFSSDNLWLHVDLSMIEDNTEVTPIMGLYAGNSYPKVTSSNKNFYPLGLHYAFTSKVLFFGDISKYKDEHGKYPTYENAV